MSAQIKTEKQKSQDLKNLAKKSADIFTDSAYSSFEIGQKASTTFTTMTKGVAYTNRKLLGKANHMIVARTPDIYDAGSQGEGDLSQEAASALAGNSLMIGNNVTKVASGVTGVVLDKAIQAYFTDKKSNDLKGKQKELLSNSKVGNYQYKEIILGRSRKDIVTQKDRLSIVKTKENEFYSKPLNNRVEAVKEKYKIDEFKRFEHRKHKWEKRADYLKSNSFSLHSSIIHTIDNQTRKAMNRPSQILRKNGDYTLASAYDFTQKGIRGGLKSTSYVIRNRRAIMKGTTSIIKNIRHPTIAIQNLFRMLVSFISSLFSFIVSLPALLVSIISMLPIIIAVIIVVTVITTLFGWWNELTKVKIEAVGLSAEVLAYEDDIDSALDKWWDEEWKPLVMAVMMQESAGKGCDPMQASESHYNQLYDKVAAGTSCEVGITDSKYSIEVGVKHLRDVIELGHVEGVDDLENLPYALQGYNFGTGWFDKYKEWTSENAQAFSKYIGGGDPNYPYHVLRYYSIGGIGGAVDNMPNFSNDDAWKSPSNPYAPNYYGQCTWFAWGRFYEIYGYSPGFTGNGYECVGQLLLKHSDKFVPSYTTPKAGAVFSVVGDGLNHVGIIISFDGKNVTWQDGNYNGITDNWENGIKDWRQQTDTLENFKTRYAGTKGMIIYANHIVSRNTNSQEE